ncbi:MULTISPECIES: hypothetical protein [Aeromonas]
MSEYSATISWQRGEHEPFVDQRYSRAHECNAVHLREFEFQST